jgi:hypothetical protein
MMRQRRASPLEHHPLARRWAHRRGIPAWVGLGPLGLAIGLLASGCPQSSSIVPYPTGEPCDHEGQVLGIVPCADDQYAVRICADGKDTVTACGQEVGCVAGAVGTASCGFNGQGQMTRSCIFARRVDARIEHCESGDTDAACAYRWTSFGPCVGDDVCRNGVSQRVACADWATTRSRECLDGAWLDGACTDPAANCEHGRTDLAGPCEHQQPSRFFSLGAYTACFHGQLAAPTVCQGCDRTDPAGALMTVCGLNGRSAFNVSCTQDGLWNSRCDDLDRCVLGATRPTACGQNGRGVQQQTCRASEGEDRQTSHFEDDGPCVDADECGDGARRVIDGDCALGRVFQRCVNGQWMRDMCLPHCDEGRPCLFGACHRGDGDDESGVCLQPSCDDGIWNGDERSTDSDGQRCPRAAEETLCNGRDDDGDGETDEGGAPPRFCGVGACLAPYSPDAAEDPCGPSRCTPGYPSMELPDGGMDEDCDGAVDEAPVP